MVTKQNENEIIISKNKEQFLVILGLADMFKTSKKGKVETNSMAGK